MIELGTETAIREPQRIRGLEMPWNRVMGSTEGPARAAHALGPWHPQEFLAECVETVPEAGAMMTFVFRRCDGAPLAFRAGQYVNVAFPVNGEDQEPVDRSYSLSSSPTEPWTFSITVKCDPTGLVSPWVHDTLALPTLRDARPSWTPPKASDVPRISTSAPLPDSVTEHSLPLQERVSELSEQAVSGSSVRPPARTPAASREACDVVVDMGRA